MFKLFIIVALLAMSGYSLANDFKLIDACGREVVIPEKIKRISAVGPGSSALTEYADYSKQLVTQDILPSMGKVHKYCACIYPEGYEKMPAVFKSFYSFTPDYTAINSANPDIVLVSGMNDRQVEKLAQSVQMPVAAMNCSETGYLHFESILQSIRLTGYILKEQKNMQDIMNFMAKTRKELIERTKDAPKKKLFIISQQYKPSKASYTVEKCYTYLRMLNLGSIGSDLRITTPFSEITFNELVAAKPDFIFVEYTMLDRFKQDYASNKALFRNIPAVKNNKVFTILPYNRYAAHYENLFINANYIGSIMYPDLFKDMNIRTLVDNISDEFTGNDVYGKMYESSPVFRQVTISEKGISIGK
ncbi:ABC transporter substrate-binding protein [Seleniivibrio sp.]|uniref:ABC transporter substrate-binding protein n=1 Tax=Seleniivibrio sp. TaxID=2898801 RepID=UPI0025E16BBB|nr:ABC transporter substrate-binding protein [Seleniivibrio sp.]MCD8553297.1 ABC transporter substrate-binding protein [Seleniivibrio sp.]